MVRTQGAQRINARDSVNGHLGNGDAMRVVTGDWTMLAPEATRIRTHVFVREQGVPAELELDDDDATSLHCVVYAGARAVATGRLLVDGHIGRMAVLQAWRGMGTGSAVLWTLMRAAAEQGHRLVVLHAQTSAQGFYARYGFEVEGVPFEEAGIEHVTMRRELDGVDMAVPDAGRAVRAP